MSLRASFRLVPLAALLIGNAALAMGPWLVRLADTGPVSAGFWRVALAVPVLFALAAGTGEARRLPDRRSMLAIAGGGLFFGLDIASWHIGIEQTRLANAVLFGNAGSVVLMVWAFIVLRRLPIGAEWQAVAAALAGAAILLGRSLELSVTNFRGDLFCLLAGLLYAGYLLLMQDVRRTIGSWSVLAGSSLVSAVVLGVIALLLAEPFWPGNWGPVVVLALSSQIVGQGLLVYALRQFPPLIIGIALLTQPAIAALVGWWVFGEMLNLLDGLGIVLVASALVLARANTAPDAAAGAGRQASARP